MEKRYRVLPPLEGSPSFSSFMDRIYTEIASEQPEHPTCYEGEWVCPHALCPVRSVRLRVKALFHRHLPRLRCPLCLRTLDFRHWLTIVTLQEVVPRRKQSSRSRRRPSPPGTAAAS